MSRHAIRISSAFYWAYLMVGITRGRAYVELGDEVLHLRFGWVRADVPYDHIRSLETLDWDVWTYGSGVRSGPEDSVGFIGAGGKVQLLRLKRRIQVKVWPLTIDERNVAVSLEDPETFREELAKRIELSAPQRPKPRPRRGGAKGGTPRAGAGARRAPPADESAFTANVVPRMSPGFMVLAVMACLNSFVFLFAALAETSAGAGVSAAVVFAAVAVLVALFWGRAHLARTEVTVGHDGVAIRRRKGEQFVPFVDIADVMEVDDVAVRLILHSGECVEIETGKAGSLRSGYIERCEEVVARIREGLERTEAQLGDGEAAERTAGRLQDRANVVLRSGEPSHRVPYRQSPALSHEELYGVLDDATASAVERAAAAVLLRSQEGAAASARLRIASEHTADPKLQRLLRVAVDEGEDEAALHEAWAVLDEAAATEAAKASG